MSFFLLPLSKLYNIPDPLTGEEDATNAIQMGKQPHEHEHTSMLKLKQA